MWKAPLMIQGKFDLGHAFFKFVSHGHMHHDPRNKSCKGYIWCGKSHTISNSLNITILVQNEIE